jgi:hypothetical protein
MEPVMTKNKHHGIIINQQYIKNCFNKYNFFVDEIVTYNNYFKVYISKDYSKDFNIKFDGLIKLEVIISPQMYDYFVSSPIQNSKKYQTKYQKNLFITYIQMEVFAMLHQKDHQMKIGN